MSTVYLVIKLSLFILAGYIAVKCKVVDDNFHKPLTSLMMSFSIPALILRSFYTTELSDDTLTAVGTMLEIAIVAFILLFCIGYVARKMLHIQHEKQVAIYAMMTTNFTFFGMPFVLSVFGAEGVFYYTIFTTFARVIYYGCPAYLLGDGEKGTFKDFLKHMISPSIICVFIGFFMYCVQIQPPAFLDGAVESMSMTCTPFGMMLCGMTLATAPLKEAFSDLTLIYMSIARLMVCPAVVMAVCYMIGFRPLFVELAVTYCAMPFGALLPTFATQYCSDHHCAVYGSALVSVSTLLCIFTIPFWLIAFNFLY